MRNDEALRQKGLGLDLRDESFTPDGHGMTDDDISVYRRLIGTLDGLSRDEVAKLRGSEAIPRIINHAVEEAGIVLHPEDLAWRQLELAFVKAQRKASKQFGLDSRARRSRRQRNSRWPSPCR